MATKIAILFAVLYLFQVCHANRDKFIKCAEEEGIPLEEAEILNHNLTVADTNPKLKCLIACYMKASEVMDGCVFTYGENEQLDSDVISVLDECKANVKSQERCGCGYEVFMCLNDLGQKRGK